MDGQSRGWRAKVEGVGLRKIRDLSVTQISAGGCLGVGGEPIHIVSGFGIWVSHDGWRHPSTSQKCSKVIKVVTAPRNLVTGRSLLNILIILVDVSWMHFGVGAVESDKSGHSA